MTLVFLFIVSYNCEHTPPCYCFDTKLLMRERALVTIKGSDHDNNDYDNTDDMLMMMLMMKLMIL